MIAKLSQASMSLNITGWWSRVSGQTKPATNGRSVMRLLPPILLGFVQKDLKGSIEPQTFLMPHKQWQAYAWGFRRCRQMGKPLGGVGLQICNIPQPGRISLHPLGASYHSSDAEQIYRRGRGHSWSMTVAATKRMRIVDWP